MKLSRKVLAAFSVVAMLATAMVVTSCKSEDDDDELEAITGSNNNYAINFTNTTDGMYRAYHATYNKHRGGLCQISLDEDSYNAGNGTIGYIFDLESNPARAVKDPRTLCIVGYNLERKKAYVSRFNNVTDIQADNFGTGLAENPATEKEYYGWASTCAMEAKDLSLTKDSDNKYVFTVDVNGEDKSAGYVVKIYKGKVEKADLATATPVDTVTIPTADLYPNLADSETKMPQKGAAVYVNVFQGKKMNATWHYADTYSAAEIAE